ncbi:MAG: T9SS type A sorting domain-containing protein [Bacteroidota bacterium]
MKKIILLICLFSATGTFAKKVKFAVDMTGQTLNVTGMHISGDFQTLAGFPGGDWASNTTPLAQEGATNIYSIIVEIPAFAKYEYKFVNGDQFYDAEFVPEQSRVGYNFNDNRWLYVDSLADDTVFVGAILFGGNAPAGLYLFRTLVDMSSTGSVPASGVHLAATFNFFDPGITKMYSFGANVYEIISYVTATSVDYKFYNGNTIVDGETVPGSCALNSNRNIMITGDTVLSVVCFSSCTACVQSISENIQDKFKIYPNPGNADTYLKFYNTGADRSVEITDAAGRIVTSYSDVTGDLIISRNGLENGLYIINVISEGNKTASGKLILQ